MFPFLPKRSFITQEGFYYAEFPKKRSVIIQKIMESSVYSLTSHLQKGQKGVRGT